jgi:hypothetical protein
MISGEFVSYAILSAGTWLDRANLLVDMCDLIMFFFTKIFRRSTLPGNRKSSIEPPSYEGCNYVSFIANFVD